MPLTEERAREIIREENLRALRLSLAIAYQMRIGYVVHPDIFDEPPIGVTVSGLQLDVLNYREGR